MELRRLTKRSKFFLEDPWGPSCTPFINTRSSSTLVLKTPQIWSFVKSLTTLSTSIRPTTSSNSPDFLTATAIFKRSTHSWQFTIWSESFGHPIIGTPIAMLSIIEFHPQCVRNPLTIGCARIWSCGAQEKYTKPLSFVLSKKPLGRRLATIDFSPSGVLTTQRKCTPLASSPRASSHICSLPCIVIVPKQTYKTSVDCLDNHFKHSLSPCSTCSFSCKAWSPSPMPSRRGPIVNTLGTYNSNPHP